MFSFKFICFHINICHWIRCFSNERNWKNKFYMLTFKFDEICKCFGSSRYAYLRICRRNSGRHWPIKYISFYVCVYVNVIDVSFSFISDCGTTAWFPPWIVCDSKNSFDLFWNHLHSKCLAFICQLLLFDILLCEIRNFCCGLVCHLCIYYLNHKLICSI